MRKIFIIVALVAACTLGGCRGGGSGSSAPSANNGGTAPTNPNPAPGTPDPTTDNSVFVQTVFTTGSTDTVVFSVALLGSAHDATNPGANGTLPPEGYRFKGTFQYTDQTGSRQTVELEVSTFNPQVLTASSSAKQLGVNPDVRFTLEVLDGLPPSAGTPVETLIDGESIVPSSSDEGFTLGFDNPSTPPQSVP